MPHCLEIAAAPSWARRAAAAEGGAELRVQGGALRGSHGGADVAELVRVGAEVVGL